jgi:tetratricopeptide (TPR) repeat protein
MSRQLHESLRGITTKNLLIFSILATLSLAIESYAVAVLEFKLLPLLLLSVIHFFIVAAICFWVMRTYRRKEDMSLPLFLALMVGVMGIFGAILCLVMAGIYALNWRHATPFATWFAELFPDNAPDEREAVYERIIFGLDNIASNVDVEPFQDIFTYGTLQQKQMALMKITRYFRAQFTPMLMRAVNDNDVAVRVQAATVITKIDRNFMEKTLSLESALKEDPDNSEKMLLLAASYNEYAESGILDTLTADKNRLKAIDLYRQCLEQDPSLSHLNIMLGRLYFKRNQPELSYRYYRNYIDEHGLNSLDLTLGYMETLMLLGAYTELRNLLVEYPLQCGASEGDIDQSEIMSLIECWNTGLGRQIMHWGLENEHAKVVPLVPANA